MLRFLAYAFKACKNCWLSWLRYPFYFLSSFFRLLLEASSSQDRAVNWVLRGWRNTWRPRPSPSLSNRRIHKCYLVSLSFFFFGFLNVWLYKPVIIYGNIYLLSNPGVPFCCDCMCQNFILRALLTYPADKNYVIFMDLLRYENDLLMNLC